MSVLLVKVVRIFFVIIPKATSLNKNGNAD